MWWSKTFEWFEKQVLEILGKLPSIKAFLDSDGSGNVELWEVWAKVKVAVSVADQFVENWKNLSPGQKQEAVAAMVRKAFPGIKDSALFTMINLAVLGWKIFKVMK